MQFSCVRAQEDVESVAKGAECGIGMDGSFAYFEGDLIQSISIVEKKRRIEFAGVGDR